MKKKKLVQILTINGEMGEFEPQGIFLNLDATDQIDLLNDWICDLEQYRRHVMALHFLALAKKEGDQRTWQQKLAAFRDAGTQMGLIVPDDFEHFVETHLECKSLPIKSESCPVCNPYSVSQRP
jgi:hypothetical protein